MTHFFQILNLTPQPHPARIKTVLPPLSPSVLVSRLAHALGEAFPQMVVKISCGGGGRKIGKFLKKNKKKSPKKLCWLTTHEGCFVGRGGGVRYPVGGSNIYTHRITVTSTITIIFKTNNTNSVQLQGRLFSSYIAHEELSK